MLSSSSLTFSLQTSPFVSTSCIYTFSHFLPHSSRLSSPFFFFFFFPASHHFFFALLSGSRRPSAPQLLSQLKDEEHPRRSSSQQGSLEVFWDLVVYAFECLCPLFRAPFLNPKYTPFTSNHFNSMCSQLNKRGITTNITHVYVKNQLI